MFDYIRDPKAIYAESFRMIRAETDARGGDTPNALETRLIHACGMVDILDDLEVSEGAIEAGQAALKQGKPIFCDAEMVARGIIGRALDPSTEINVTLNDPATPALATKLSTTRSAAAVELWRDQIEGAIVVIGNAPTALFQLLERLLGGWPAPSLIIGMPVGFVGAAESKAALSGANLGIPFITIHGRRGGSALASAAVNSLSLGLQGDGT